VKRALLTGAAGQLAHYLIPALQQRGVSVSGLVQSHSQLRSVAHDCELLVGDVTDVGALGAAIQRTEPDAIFHLASPTFVPDSWSSPAAALQGVTAGTLSVLDAARLLAPRARIVNASSSEVFSRAKESPQTSRTSLAPANPYGIFKAAAFELTRSYRERHALGACSLVLYPFESPLRADSFVVPKICHGAARIAAHGGRLALGDLSARRDWSWAEDVAGAFVAAAESPEPRDALIGSGELHAVSEVVELAFAEVGLNWRDHVDVDERFVRPAEPVLMTPDVAETFTLIGWRPSTRFEDIVRRMVLSARE
jgi:GDPmannose 4,6-dehydratase